MKWQLYWSACALANAAALINSIHKGQWYLVVLFVLTTAACVVELEEEAAKR